MWHSDSEGTVTDGRAMRAWHDQLMTTSVFASIQGWQPAGQVQTDTVVLTH